MYLQNKLHERKGKGIDHLSHINSEIAKGRLCVNKTLTIQLKGIKTICIKVLLGDGVRC